MMGQHDHTLPPHKRGPPLLQWSAPFHSYPSALVSHPLLLRGPTSSIAGWRCSECEHCCGSSHNRDYTDHRNSAAHSWQQHRNSPPLPVEVFHVWCAAPSNQCSRWTPPHWNKTDASQRYRAPAAFPSALRPTSKVDCQQQLCCVHDDQRVPSIHPLWAVAYLRVGLVGPRPHQVRRCPTICGHILGYYTVNHQVPCHIIDYLTYTITTGRSLVVVIAWACSLAYWYLADRHRDWSCSALVQTRRRKFFPEMGVVLKFSRARKRAHFVPHY